MPVILRAPLAIKLQPPVSPVVSTISQELGLVVSNALSVPILQSEMLRVQHVTYPAMDVFRLQPHAKIVPLTMSPQVQGQPAPFVLQEPSLHKETPPARHAMPPAKPVSKRQPHASPAISIMNRGQGLLVLSASWELSPLSEIQAAHLVTYRVMAATRLQLRARIVP